MTWVLADDENLPGLLQAMPPPFPFFLSPLCRFFQSIYRLFLPIKLFHLNFGCNRIVFKNNTKYMKSIIAFTSLFAFAMVSSCGNRNAGSRPEVAAIGGSGSATSGTDAVFSYTLQGKKISGGTTDVIQVSNIAYIQKSGQITNIQFFLNDIYDDNTSTFAHSLRFTVPAKTGTTQLAPGQDNGHVELFVSKGSDGAYIVYGNEAFTINVSAITSTRVSGTFSGKVKSASETGDEFAITDGKFEVPLGTTAK
jgi:hypothetical protein